MIGWTPDAEFTVDGQARTVAELLLERAGEGMVDLWNAIPAGQTMTAGALASLRARNSVAIAQGITLVQQQVTTAIGLGPGYRPELFEQIANLPAIDILATTAIAAFQGNLSLADLTSAAKAVLIDVVEYVGEAAKLGSAIADYYGAVLIVVKIIWDVIEHVVRQVQLEKELAEQDARATLACVAPAFSASLDQAQVAEALAILSGPDWTALFVPEVRPVNPDLLKHTNIAKWGPDAQEWAAESPMDWGPGFTCCATEQGWRVIAPVGTGVGNRVQSAIAPTFYTRDETYGFGLLPMCADLPCHRAFVYGGVQLEAASSLPLLSSLGVQTWAMMWTRGPAAFTVDGLEIANAWSEYLRSMHRQLARDEPGVGGSPMFNYKVCDDWGGAKKVLRWFFDKIGMSGAEELTGIIDWEKATPVRAWLTFADYQAALLERVGIVYVDARSCHPAWRERVAEAQQRVVDHSTAPCEVLIDDVPDPALRELLSEAKRRKGVQCFAISSRVQSYSAVSWSEGPSLIPVTDDPAPIPSYPKPRGQRAIQRVTGARPPATGGARPPLQGRVVEPAASGGGGGVVLALGAAALLGLVVVGVK